MSKYSLHFINRKRMVDNGIKNDNHGDNLQYTMNCSSKGEYFTPVRIIVIQMK